MRILSASRLFALALLLAVLSCASTALAAEFLYDVDDDNCAIVSTYLGKSKSVVIPDKIDGLTVTGLKDYLFYGNASLEKVTLPNTIRTIGKYAFAECSQLKSINLPEGLVSIGNSAFYYCYALNDVTFPSTLTSIGSSAFQYTGLTSVVLPEHLTTVSFGAFSKCRNLKSLVIPPSVTTIEDRAFEGCTNLEVTIPSTVKEIGENAFSGCIVHTDDEVPPTIDETVRKQAMEIVEQTVARLCHSSLSAYDNAVALHDWLCNNTSRDTEKKQNSGYELLVSHTGSDKAYVEAYGLLLDAAGIEHTFDEGADHRWSVVKLGGEWCHIDCWWDDAGLATHTFFGLPDKIMHEIRGNEGGTFTGASTYKLFYAYHTGALDSFISQAVEQIHLFLAAGSSSFEIELRHPDDVYPMNAKITAMAVSDMPFTFGNEEVYVTLEYLEHPEVPYRNCRVNVIGCHHEHTEVRDMREVTCAAEGYTGDVWCLDCGKCIHTGTAVTELLPHTPRSTGSVPPTDTEPGLTEGYVCAICGAVLVEQEVIPPTGSVTETKLIPGDDGLWYLYEDGEPSTRSGIVSFQGGKFHIIEGVLASDENGLILVDGKWYFVSAGQVQTQYTGLAQYDGEWFYIAGGMLNTNTNGLVDYDGSRFLVAAGRILYSVSGLWQNAGDTITGADGRWYFLSNGQVQTQYTGLTIYDGHWFYLRNGLLAVDYTGLVLYEGSVFEVVNGMVVGN